MAGLLDFEDPNTAGAIQLGLGLLNAGGPSRMPVSLGQGIAQGGTMAMDAMRQARQDLLKKKLMQIEAEKGQLSLDQVKEELAADKKFVALWEKTQTPKAAPNATPYGGGYSPAVSEAFGGLPVSPQSAPQQQNPASKHAAMLEAARQSGSLKLYQRVVKMIDDEQKLAPKYGNTPHVVTDKSGNDVLVQTADDGTVRPIQGGYGPKRVDKWSEPYQLAGATVQKNETTGQVHTAVSRPSQINIGGDATSLMTDDTLDMDAWRYLTDGTLPPNMGRGIQGAKQAATIRNKSSALAKDMGMEPSEIRFAQLENKAQVTAIAALARAKAQILQFEKTANNNADLALEQSRNVWRTGSPMVNRPLQWLQSEGAGDPGVKVFNAANETFISEYARVMSGGYGAAQTTEGAQTRAHKLLSTASTSEQYEAVVTQLKREMGNRVKALNDQMAEERSNLRRGVKPSATSSAQPAASSNSQPMDSKPKASEHKGRTIRDTITNEMLVSNGMSWVPVKK